MKRTFLIALFLLATAVVGSAQQLPYAKEMAAFRQRDSLQPPPKKAILFVGSSSFTNWTDAQQYFPQHTIINRGFGGSTLPDVIRYEDETIFRYKPKQVVIYCGENDIASSDTVSAQTVFNRFQQLFTDIRNRLGKVPIAFISIKPSPSRWHMRARMQAANDMIKTFLAGQKRTAFINVWPAMLNVDGEPIQDIFKEDRLHMNARGYAIWQKLIEPKLIK